MDDVQFAAALSACEAFVRRLVVSSDSAHDFLHIDRVRRCALMIASSEHVRDALTLFVIELAALLHDVNDWKLATHTLDIPARLVTFGVTDGAVVARVSAAVSYCGYRASLSQPINETAPLEVRIVRDADQLDAIGAIGIARAFAYGGAHRRALYRIDALDVLDRVKTLPPPTEREYVAAHAADADTSTLDHFVDKLFRIAATMQTSTARRIAKERHAIMERFVQAMRREVIGDVSPEAASASLS